MGDTLFGLDRNGFDGNFEGNNDLSVNLTSQVGGLNSALRVTSNILFDELHSHVIQKDVITLLNSSNNKFADAIGIGSTCNIPEQWQ